LSDAFQLSKGVLGSGLKIDILEVSDNLPDPEVIAQEIVKDLEAALEQFREIVGDLGVKEKD
jgi:type I restriction enzyme M protein